MHDLVGPVVTAEDVDSGLVIKSPPAEFSLSIVGPGIERHELLRIKPDGSVVAPSLEDASEAGRVFVASLRGALHQRERELSLALREALNGYPRRHVVAGSRLLSRGHAGAEARCQLCNWLAATQGLLARVPAS